MSVRFVAFGLFVLTMTVPLGYATDGPASLGAETVGVDQAPPGAVAGRDQDDDAAARPARGGPMGPPAPWWVGWSHDLDGDGLDDTLQRDPWTPDARFDVFVRFTRTPTDDDLDAVRAAANVPGRVFPLAEAVYLAGVDPLRFDALLAVPDVVAIERERRVVPALDVAAPTSMVTFSPELGNGARARWKVIGRDVTVAVLDTGIDQEHEVFEPRNFLGGYDATIPTGSLRDFVYENLLTLQPLDAVPAVNVTTDLPSAEEDPDDIDPHGTAVAGIVFGVDPNGTYHGMAPAVKYLDVKVLGDDQLVDSRSDLPFGLGSTVIEGLEFVKRYNEGRTHLGDPGNDTVDIVTMSLAETQPDPKGDSTIAHAVNRLVDTGVVVVAAAGNCGPGGSPDKCARLGNNTIAAPGSARQAITVGAYDDGGTVAWRDDLVDPGSSQGPNGGERKPNVVAPGMNITAPRGVAVEGARATDQYAGVNGTSAATPVVTGVVALMLEADPTMTPADVKRLLMDSARDMGDPGWDPSTGAGAVRAYLAVGVALGFITLETDPLDEFGRELQVEVDDNDTNESKPPVQNQPPDVAFEVGPSVVTVDAITVFIDRSTDRERDELVAFNWDFGDGHTGKGARAAHVFEKAGEYTVRLSVTDVNGSSGYARETVTVHPGDDQTEESPALPFVPFMLMMVVVALLRRGRNGTGPS